MENKVFLTFLMLFVVLFPSCNKMQLSRIYDDSIDDNWNPQKEFAVILSLAVSDNPELRGFLKEEACKLIDNDYEVFYPWTKEKLVTSDQTFRDVLLSYCENESALLKIENALPLLTILLPDLSWISEDLFNPAKWDVSNPEVMVTYRDGNNTCEYLERGETSFCVSPNEVIDGVILVVKSNERIAASTSTKSGEQPNYDFIAEEFDGTKQETKVASWVYSTTVYSNCDYSDNVTASVLENYSPISIAAYKEFGSNAFEALQRDYCYYGMTLNNRTSGTLNRRIKEGLFRFRFIDVNNYVYVCDDTESSGKDPEYSDYVCYEKNDGGVGKTFFGLMADGRLEIFIDFYYGVIGTGTASLSKAFDIFPSDVLQVKKVKKGYQHKTWFNRSHYSYEVTFEPKWYYPKYSVNFFNWDLFQYSTTLLLHFWEKDSGATYSYSDVRSVTWEFSGSFDREKNSGSVKTKLGLNTSYKNAHSETMTWAFSQQNDDLGWGVVGYDDDVIKAKTSEGYTLNHNTTGNRIIFNIIPYVD